MIVINQIIAKHRNNFLFTRHLILFSFITVFINKCSCQTEQNSSQKQLETIEFEAISFLHRQLDDDANGNVDIAESDEFLRDELKYENGYERQKAFHGNDKHISVDELWKAWQASEVRNWTVEETIDWLVNVVELPQYVTQFQANAVDGTSLPRMAATNTYFFTILGIKDAIHKQKLALKAMDVVLFGAPKHHNYVKDIILVFSLVVAIGGCWFAYIQHKYSQTHLKKMMKDMDSLQKAEEQLTNLQKELDKAREEQLNVVMEKQTLEKKLKQNEVYLERSASFNSLGEVNRILELEEDLRQTKDELRRAELALSSRSWIAPPKLQHWLQLTYELELKNYNAKKAAAEVQLQAAREGCEKLRKKRGQILGAFRVAHGNSIDDIDNKILQAKAALSDVTNDLKERLHRWNQIESFCNFPIIHNPGLMHLESLLFGTTNGTLRDNLSSNNLAQAPDSLGNEESHYSTVEELIKNSLFALTSPLTLPICELSAFMFQNADQSLSASNALSIPFDDAFRRSSNSSMISNLSDRFSVSSSNRAVIDGDSAIDNSNGLEGNLLSPGNSHLVISSKSKSLSTSQGVLDHQVVLDDSVGSLDEQEKEEDEFTYELPSKHTSFVVGDSSFRSQSLNANRPKRERMVKSYSQDHGTNPPPGILKLSHSESCHVIESDVPTEKVNKNISKPLLKDCVQRESSDSILSRDSESSTEKKKGLFSLVRKRKTLK